MVDKSSIDMVEKELTYEDLKRLKVANFLKPIEQQDPTVDEKIKEYFNRQEEKKAALHRAKIKIEPDPEAQKKLEDDTRVNTVDSIVNIMILTKHIIIT